MNVKFTIEDSKKIFRIDSNLLSKLVDKKTKLLINGDLANVGDYAVNGDTLSLVIDSGYEFVDSPYIVFYNDYNYFIEERFINGELYISNKLNGYSSNDIEIEVKKSSELLLGNNSIFRITNKQLKELNKKRFEIVGSSPPQTIDRGVNILGVIKLPFKIDDSIVLGEDEILLGNYNTDIKADRINVDSVYYNLGDIEVPKPDNSIGFTNTSIKLHLPLANFIELPIEYVMGYTINIEYVINLYSGATHINVKSSKTGDNIVSSNVDLGINVPYSSIDGYTQNVTNTSISMGGDNHIKTPHIEVIQKTPILGNGFFTSPIVEEGFLNSCSGYVVLDDVNLKTKANSYENSVIISALKSGVIFK